MLDNGVGGVESDQIIGGIAVGQAEVVRVGLQVNKGLDELASDAARNEKQKDKIDTRRYARRSKFVSKRE